MIKRASWLCSLALLSVGCGEQDAILILDFSSVMQQRHALVEPLDELVVSMTGPQGTTLLSVDATTPSFEIPIAAGPIALEAVGSDTTTTPGTPIVTYYGDKQLFVPAGGEFNAQLKIYPAGVLDVTVQLDAGSELETLLQQAVITFTALNIPATRTEQSTVFDIPFQDGALQRILPSGNYDFEVQFSLDGGQEFQAVPVTLPPVVIPHAGTVAENVDLRGVTI